MLEGGGGVEANFDFSDLAHGLTVTTVTILAREMPLEILSTKSRDMTSRARKISLKFVENMSIFNRIYYANIVTRGPRNTSKACFVQKLSIALLVPTL